MTDNEVMSPVNRRLLPWIAAIAFFMQTLDVSILTTALPAMAYDLKESPINMQSSIISYTLTLALFMPLNGFLADRFGTRTVFITAIWLFVFGSLCCALSNSLLWLDVSRVLQGIGGSMMVPVSRLVLIKCFQRHAFLSALNTSLTLGLVGSLIGPLLGGYLVQTWSWHWLFLINLPVGLMGIIAGFKFMPNIYGTRLPFDFIGALLISAAVVSATLTFEFINEDVSITLSALLFILSILLLWCYQRYANYVNYALFPLSLFKLHTFCIGLMGNLISRVGVSSIPMLGTLLLQVVFGYSPFMAGVMLVPMAVAAVMMKPLAKSVLTWYGYRRVLFCNTLIIGSIIISLSLLNQRTSMTLIMLQFFALGFANSLNFAAMNSIALADLNGDLTSAGNSLLTVNQQLAMSFGIAIGMALIRLFSQTTGPVDNTMGDAFKATFIVLGVITCLSSFIFSRLHPGDGGNLIIRAK